MQWIVLIKLSINSMHGSTIGSGALSSKESANGFRQIADGRANAARGGEPQA
jgi:hypothetical protein